MSDQEHQPEADFVVAGAGTAACVIAARLSEYLDNVVLLEAGLIDGPEMMAIPSAAAALSGSTVDWAFRSEPQSALDGAVLEYPRGRVLGGSSSINAMAHIRAHRSSYDDWVRAGASGWGYDDLLPYFRRSERTGGPNSRWRGIDGPMQVAVSAGRPVHARPPRRRPGSRNPVLGRPQRPPTRRARDGWRGTSSTVFVSRPPTPMSDRYWRIARISR